MVFMSALALSMLCTGLKHQVQLLKLFIKGVISDYHYAFS